MFGLGTATLLVEMFILINGALTLLVCLPLFVWHKSAHWADKVEIIILVVMLGGPLLWHQVTAIGPALYLHDEDYFIYAAVFSFIALLKAIRITRKHRRR